MDCFALYGWPFKDHNGGGFAGEAEILWRGLILNLLIVVAGSLGLTVLWTRLRKKRVPDEPWLTFSWVSFGDGDIAPG
ncbi:MAG TPA: hypothetical protein VGN16_15215 [Acidobacteriaceae bacterium]